MSTSSVFISTVPAKQMARELEISAGIITELRQLLQAAKASARTERRKRQRKAAKLRARIAELEGAVESEKQRAEDFADEYTTIARRYQVRREECDILRSRCEEREAEISEMRQRPHSDVDLIPFLLPSEVAKHLRSLGYSDQFLRCSPADNEWQCMLARKLTFHTRLLGRFPRPSDEVDEEDTIYVASADQLRQMMQDLTPNELLPVGHCLNPEEEDDEVARDRELNAIRQNTPLKMVNSPKLMREFLLRWRWHHKRLPGGFVVPEGGLEWGGEGAGEEVGEAGIFDCHCCSCDDAEQRDE